MGVDGSPSKCTTEMRWVSERVHACVFPRMHKCVGMVSVGGMGMTHAIPNEHAKGLCLPSLQSKSYMNSHD